jgi:hypothetical protein
MVCRARGRIYPSFLRVGSSRIAAERADNNTRLRSLLLVVSLLRGSGGSPPAAVRPSTPVRNRQHGGSLHVAGRGGGGRGGRKANGEQLLPRRKVRMLFQSQSWRKKTISTERLCRPRVSASRVEHDRDAPTYDAYVVFTRGRCSRNRYRIPSASRFLVRLHNRALECCGGWRGSCMCADGDISDRQSNGKAAVKVSRHFGILQRSQSAGYV